jgi:putative cell wall-binding protein
MNHPVAVSHGARRFVLAAFCTTLLAATLLAPVSPVRAEPGPGPSDTAAERIPALLCPQQSAVVGFPLGAAPLAQSGTLRVAAGSLPAGVRVHTGGLQLVGVPSAVETASFTLELSTVRPDGFVDLTTKACTVIVKPAPAVTRIAGADRYQQALAVSGQTFRDNSSDTVFVASGEKFADALSATAVAAHRKAPLLLTLGAWVPAGLGGEIRRVGAEQIVVGGGEASVSASVVSQLEAATGAKVTRIGGSDRFEVSRALIGHPSFGFPSATTVFLANGAGFADALTASPAAATLKSPVLLVDGGRPAPAPADVALLTGLGTRAVAVMGGTTSIGAALATSLEKSFAVTRYAGATRFEVGAAVNGATFPSASRVYLANGDSFPDALSGGVAAGIDGSPLYVTRGSCLPAAIHLEIGRLAPAKVILLGGPTSLTPALESLPVCPAD